ncbi:unnamed protein product, partial [Meganyctiphanes norvegica]
KTFQYKNILKDHHNIHTGKKPYQCSECDQTFRQKSHLQRHKKMHTTYESGQLQSHQCWYCGNAYRYREGLKRHMKKKHKGQIETFKIETVKPEPHTSVMY